LELVQNDIVLDNNTKKIDRKQVVMKIRNEVSNRIIVSNNEKVTVSNNENYKRLFPYVYDSRCLQLNQTIYTNDDIELRDPSSKEFNIDGNKYSLNDDPICKNGYLSEHNSVLTGIINCHNNTQLVSRHLMKVYCYLTKYVMKGGTLVQFLVLLNEAVKSKTISVAPDVNDNANRKLIYLLQKSINKQAKAM